MFMVHGDIYRHIRDLVADAVYCNKFQQLQEALNVRRMFCCCCCCCCCCLTCILCNISIQDPDISCFLNLALYEIVLLDWQRLKQLPKVHKSTVSILAHLLL